MPAVTVKQAKQKSMEYKILGKNNDIVFADTNEQIIKDIQSALDFITSKKYETGYQKVIVNKTCLTDDFLFSVRAMPEKFYRNSSMIK